MRNILCTALAGALLLIGLSAANPESALQVDGCPSAATRLSPGDIAIVSEAGGPSGLNLRVQPSLGQEIILSIPIGAQVTIIAGPKCKGGYRWYEVGYNGKDGWSAEVGRDGVYNLDPNTPSQESSQASQSESSNSLAPGSTADSLIGEWKGSVTYKPLGDNNWHTDGEMDIKVLKQSDGHLTLSYMPPGIYSGPSSAEISDHIDSSGVCFNNMRRGAFESSCLSLANSGELNYRHTIGASETAHGILHQVSTDWPSSLVGIWEGDVECTVTFRSPETCHDVEEIWPDANGNLVGITNNNPSIGWEQKDYEKINNQYYYCFRLYNVLGDATSDIGERCFRQISDDELDVLGSDLAGSISGTLHRQNASASPPSGMALGCEPANGKVQYGIINIGPDVFVIYCGERRLVPNPITLDALGISRNMIDNMGMSDAELTAIPRGPDIPDITRDPQGFNAFKQIFDAQVAPALGINPASQPIQPVPTQEPSTQTPFLGINWCNVPLIGLFACPPEAHASNTTCSPQCVVEAHKKRPDLDVWASGAGTSDNILSIASKSPHFTWDGTVQQVRVRASENQSENPQAGDLIVWPRDCQGVWAPVDKQGNPLPGGHIGYVSSYQDGHLVAHDANWNNACGIRDEEIKIVSCMKFITSPYPVGSYQSTPALPVDKCSQYQGLRKFLCQLFP